ncbi:MAG: glycosyl transferase family 1, partial [Actinobacteria bacterium]
MRVLYFGTYERDYPRNAQVIAALRRAGIHVLERHVPVWEGRAHKWRAGARSLTRLALAEARLFRRPREDFDALIVGYPGHLDLAAARRVAGPRPVVFNP